MTKFTLADGLAALHGTDYARLLERRSFDVGIYAPESSDRQAPHRRDEVYVIAQGQGQLVLGDLTHSCVPGDLFHVPAGMKHHFANVSAGFLVWVIFVGPNKVDPESHEKPRHG